MINHPMSVGVNTGKMENYNEEKYNRAKKKVKQVKGFYSHLTVYIVVNTLLILMHMGLFQNGILNLEYPTLSMFSTPIFWGIGLLLHALFVFQDGITFFRKWEERKMKEFMDEEERDFKSNNKWE